MIVAEYLWTISRWRNGHREVVGYCDAEIDADRYRGRAGYDVAPPTRGRVVPGPEALGRVVRVVHRDGRTNLQGSLIDWSRHDVTVSTTRGTAITVPRRNVWRIEPIGWRPITEEAHDAR